jgi:hypothetical protein
MINIPKTLKEKNMIERERIRDQTSKKNQAQQ